MTITEFVKKRINQQQDLERKIITSMQEKDFGKAVYLDQQLKDLIRKDSNISLDFKRLF